ncbi:hypothetical protein LDENG_00070260, partial [Lucifuga dentata]
VSSSQVKRQVERLYQNKAAGSDGISPWVLKACTDQLCEILQHLFNLSLSQRKVPVLWKTSRFVLVPKKSHPSTLNGYRPVGLTSHIMKVLEKMMLAHLRPQVRPLWTHCSLYIGPRLEMKMPSSTCFSEPTVTWTKQAAMLGSCSLISPEPLTHPACNVV